MTSSDELCSAQACNRWQRAHMVTTLRALTMLIQSLFVVDVSLLR